MTFQNKKLKKTDVITIRRSWLELMSKLADAEQLEIINGIARYCAGEQAEIKSAFGSLMFAVIAEAIDKEEKKDV